jgi:hypothetical protein
MTHQLHPTFEQLVGDVDEFFKSYFGRKSLLRKRALPSATSLLSFHDLDDLLQSEAIRPPHLRVTRAGMTVRESTYTGSARVQDEQILQTPEPRLVLEHLRLGATITWNSMNQYVPRLRALATEIGRAFATRSDVVAFVTPAGQPGFAPHYDPTDVIVIQIEGTKAWKVWEVPDGYQLPAGPKVDISDLGAPAIDEVLHPGDILYVPHRRPHVAVCEDTMSLHLSCTIRPRTWADALMAVVESLVLEEPLWQEFPALAWTDPKTLHEELKSKLDILGSRVTQLDPATQLDRFVAAGTDVEGIGRVGLLEEVAKVDELGSQTLVRLAADCVVEDGDSDEVMRVRAKGNLLQLPASVRAVLEDLQTSGPRAVENLATGFDTEVLTSQAKKLVRAGVLELA